MRRAVIAASIGVLAMAGLTGQTPSPPPAATPSKPLRHLEFAFRVDRENVTEYHYNGIGNGVQTSSGVGGRATSEGGRGTMYVDVLSIAPDGGLVVKIWELVQNEPRPRAAYTCTVYGNTRVVCPTGPAPSQAEWVLLGYLGRRFVDGAPWDAQHHWQRKEDTAQALEVEDFAITGGDDAHPLIRETKKIDMHNGGFSSTTENVEITYDLSMEVPDAVHDVVEAVGRGGSGNATFDFKLSSDSFGKPAPVQTSHP
jgi:hypothetical protein